MTHISEDLSPDEKSFLADLHRDVERGELVTHAGILKVARRLSGDEKYHNLFGKAVLESDKQFVDALAALQKKNFKILTDEKVKVRQPLSTWIDMLYATTHPPLEEVKARVPPSLLNPEEISFILDFYAEAEMYQQPSQKELLPIARKLVLEKYPTLFDRDVLNNDTAFFAALEALLKKKERAEPDAVENPEPEASGDTSESSSPPPLTEPPLTKDLAIDFQSREKSDHILISPPSIGEEEVSGYWSDAQTHEIDRQRLLTLVERHNVVFGPKDFGSVPNPVGVVERLDISPKDRICVRADIHGDLSTLLGHLKMLQNMGLIDQDFKCRPGVHLIFLGDYMDRGANDIEVMSLLLSLHLQNPNEVHLIRGNHEDLSMSAAFSNEWAWLGEHADVFTPLFERFPLAVAAHVPGENPPQRLLFSHGLFPIHFNLNPLFEPGAPSSLTVPEHPSLTAVDPATSGGLLEEASAKIPSSGKEGFLWSQASEVLEPILQSRGAGSGLPPEVIREWQERMGVAQSVTGHVHLYGEAKNREGKVLVTALSAATIDGLLVRVGVPQQPIQGLLIARGVGGWKKFPIMEEKGAFYPRSTAFDMAQPLIEDEVSA